MNNETAIAIMEDDVRLPQRAVDTHKGDYGRLLIVGGSVGYTGAPVLSARAASKTGAGLTSVGVPKAIYDITAIKLDEEMPFPLPDKGGCIACNAASEILRRAKSSDVCLIGPGLGMSEDIIELVSSVTRLVETPLILDADGLNAIIGNTDILTQALCPLILTPHPGEFKRLGGNLPEDYGDAQSSRIRAATAFSVKYNCILVLKGHRTIVALPNGTSFVNTTGNPAMAKGGSGDVLAGMIAALVAQHTAGGLDISMVDAVLSAVYIHGLSGDMCADRYGQYSVGAMDIINMLPDAILKVTDLH